MCRNKGGNTCEAAAVACVLGAAAGTAAGAAAGSIECHVGTRGAIRAATLARASVIACACHLEKGSSLFARADNARVISMSAADAAGAADAEADARCDGPFAGGRSKPDGPVGGDELRLEGWRCAQLPPTSDTFGHSREEKEACRKIQEERHPEHHQPP